MKTQCAALAFILFASLVSGCSSDTRACDQNSVLVTLQCGREAFGGGRLEVSRLGDNKSLNKDIGFKCPGDDFVFRIDVQDYQPGDSYELRFVPSNEGAVPVVARAVASTACLAWVIDLEQLGKLSDGGTGFIPPEPSGEVGDGGAVGREDAGNSKLADGELCSDGSQCRSGFCSDRVCCLTECSGPCEACNLPNFVGLCRPAVKGTAPAAPKSCPVSPDSMCGSDGTCDGDGACSRNTDQACEGVGTCQADKDCVSGTFCSSGLCMRKLTAGDGCGRNGECRSEFCVDGVCCDSLCNGACKSCATGTCRDIQGDDPGLCSGVRICANGCRLKDKQPCTSDADCANGACRPFFLDADGDTFGRVQSENFCGTDPPSASYVTKPGDCCDNDAQTNPARGLVPVRGLNACNSGDFNCDGDVTKFYVGFDRPDTEVIPVEIISRAACRASSGSTQGQCPYNSGFQEDSVLESSCGKQVSIDTCAGPPDSCDLLPGPSPLYYPYLLCL